MHGFRLDLSATGYLMLFPLLLMIVSYWLNGKWAYSSIRAYTYFIIALFSFFAASDLALYREWGFRMDATPLLYLARPKEAFASVSALYVIFHLLIATIIFSAFIYFFKFLGRTSFYIDKIGNRLISSGLTLILLAAMALPIRGGFGKNPINRSSTYFSDIAFLNHASLNLPWNVGFSLLNNDVVKNPYNFMKIEQAQSLVSSFTHSSSLYHHVLSTERPNIILFILESFTANVTGCLNGPIQVTPELDKIAGKGILFSQFYASGDRTDKGMLAVLSGFPSQPTTSVIKFVDKTEKLPALPKTLAGYGYTCKFYYGGDAEFASYKSYLLNAGFNNIVELKDFPKSQRISSWGVPDEFLLQKAASDLKKEKQPYFITLLTLSSHTPYDIPARPHSEGNSDEIKYYNSVFYSDHCIGKFIDTLESEGLLNNTLVIFVADHGFHLPGNLPQNTPLSYHIPLIWYGGALAKHDTIINTIGNQTDIASTLLAQLNISSDQFKYSKNIFSFDTPHKTVFEINNGFGYVSDSLTYFYYNEAANYSVIRGKINEKDILEGKAFYQVLYNDIINR